MLQKLPDSKQPSSVKYGKTYCCAESRDNTAILEGIARCSLCIQFAISLCQRSLNGFCTVLLCLSRIIDGIVDTARFNYRTFFRRYKIHLAPTHGYLKELGTEINQRS